MNGNHNIIIDTPDGRAVLKAEDFDREEDFICDGKVVQVYTYRGSQ